MNVNDIIFHSFPVIIFVSEFSMWFTHEVIPTHESFGINRFICF